VKCGNTSGTGCSIARAIASAMTSRRSRRRAQIAIDAPSRASRTATARPMPADAPLIATTRFDGTTDKLAFRVMDPVIRLLRDLVAINSVNPTLVPGAPGEAAVADAIAHEMRRLGLDVSVEPVAPGR